MGRMGSQTLCNWKDLGVYVSDDCTFGFHIRNVAVKSRNLCSWILRVSCQTKSGVWVSGVESGKKEWNSWAGDGAETVHQKNRRYRAPHIPGAIEETKIIFTGKKKREISNNISLENVRGYGTKMYWFRKKERWKKWPFLQTSTLVSNCIHPVENNKRW